jgi:hypothetical protein
LDQLWWAACEIPALPGLVSKGINTLSDFIMKFPTDIRRAWRVDGCTRDSFSVAELKVSIKKIRTFSSYGTMIARLVADHREKAGTLGEFAGNWLPWYKDILFTSTAEGDDSGKDTIVAQQDTMHCLQVLNALYFIVPFLQTECDNPYMKFQL